MRVLSLLPYPVFPLVHGGRVRAYRLAVGLARAGATVELRCPWHPAFPRRPFERQGVTIRPFLFAANALPALLGDRIVPPLLQLSLQPLTVGPRRLLRRALLYDIVEFHFCAHATWMPRLAGGPRVVYSAHNVELDYALGGPSTLFHARFARQIGMLERQAVQASDLVVACTEGDARRLRELYGEPRRLTVVSNGFDESEVGEVTQYRREVVRGELGLRPEELAILFIGGPSFHNRQAVRFLEEKVLPVLNRPARLLFAGKCARPRREGRVLALGFVDRLAPLLRAADVAVNPIQSGSGSHLKLAEYVAAGLPVITTPIGLRGYEAFAGLVTVAELDEFAHILSREPRVVGRMPEVADLGWGALARRLYQVYGELMDRRPPARSSY